MEIRLIDCSNANLRQIIGEMSIPSYESSFVDFVPKLQIKRDCGKSIGLIKPVVCSQEYLKKHFPLNEFVLIFGPVNEEEVSC